MQNAAYVIDPQISNLMPALSGAEFSQLEKEIREAKQVTDPVTVWANPDTGDKPILLDGHNRDKLWKKVSRTVSLPPLKLIRKSFGSRLDAIQWIFNHQDGRRNWTAEQRAHAVWQNAQLAEQVKRDAEERRKRKPKNQQASDDANKGRKTAEILADFAGVSAATMERTKKNAEKIENSGNEELKRRVFNPRTPEEKMTMAQAAAQIDRDKEQEKRKKIAELQKEFVLDPVPEDQKGQLDTIFLADVLDGLDRVEDDSVHIVVTSPFYPIKEIRYENKDSEYKGYADWLDKMRTVFTKIFNKVKNTGRVVIQIDTSNNRDDEDADRTKQDRPKMFAVYADIIAMMREIGFHFGWEKSWYKQNSIGSRPNWGTYQSPACPNDRRQHEYVLVFHKGPAHMEAENGMITDMSEKEFERLTMSHWYVTAEKREKVESEDFHPCPFPEFLVLCILKLWSFKGMTVLDPFSGSGTTCYVAKATQRRFIGIDHGPNYVASARKRLATLDGKTPEEMLKMLNVTEKMWKQLSSDKEQE